MAHLQRQVDVHQDDLCPPNKRYALMDANKKIDLEHPLCPNERKILANILQNHPLRFSIAASSLVPWIYLGQFWYTSKEDGSKYKLSFVLDRKELTMTLIMQMLYCFVNNIHVDYANLLWEGFHYSLEYPTTLIPYPKFTKLIASHYMTSFPEISRRAHDKSHNLEDDEMVKIIFNSGKHKDGVRMKIPSWMITVEMKLTENYRIFHSRQHHCSRRKSTIIRLRIPPRRSTRLTLPTPILTTDEADDIILQDTIQLSLAEQKSHEDLKTKQNEEKVKEHLMAKEIKKLVEGTENVEENVEVDSPTLRKNDNQNDPDTRLEPRSNKESPEVEITVVVQLVNVIEEEEESAEDDYELRRREKGKEAEETRNTPYPTTIRYPRIHSTLISSDTEKL
ncbi:hypothetical protein Tco_1418178 [Tanacetum coccineum]